MNPNAESQIDPAAVLDDIEKRVGEIFSAQKNEVEQTLIEKINREKEEAQRRIEAVNREFAQVRGFLDEHKQAMAELLTTETYLRGEIRGHFERAVNYQKMMENAAALAGDELEKIGGLNRDLEKVRVKAEEEYAGLKRNLAGYAGIVAQIPAPAAPADESDVDWNEEMGKLRRVRDLLATLRQPDAAAAPAEDELLTTAPAAPEAEELAASLGLIDSDDDGVSDDHDFALGKNPAPAGEEIPDIADLAAEIEPESAPEAVVEVAPESAAEPAVASSPESDAVLGSLARYRKTEPINNGTELCFFTGEAAAFLDAESFVAAMARIVENAGQLHSQLAQTASVKELFLLKQEILNQQEVLRKLFFRVVRFCDKENGCLPETLGEFLGSQGMKDLIERLTMANWSDPSDFKPFQIELKSIKRAFESRAAADPHYLQTVLDRIEGREN
ncbi:MAG: hypothetical protein H6P96_1123 [Candidatus Aminicenantes bacterium]|nr:hypothetical protein [Candidatus Aminicenantes bacterium]